MAPAPKPINWSSVQKLASDKFGIPKFRTGQRDLIGAALTGEDSLGILPTGAGKSLCYQLPSLLLTGNVVVVSPLIALMQDQKDQLYDIGIEAIKVDSTLSVSEEREALHLIETQGRSLIYVTPERLENAEFLALLKKGKTALVVVDEAHCVSQWGHDFRPAYLSLRSAIKQLGSPPVMALTATATDEVIEDILKQLNITSARIIQMGIERKNLYFEVATCVNDEAKRSRMLDTTKKSAGSGIVYTATIKSAEDLHGWLESQGVSAVMYHGKLNKRTREENQRSFMSDQTRVMVATKAFGLGINKPDIRFVLHYQFPDSIESYYQEAGRAGRDGKKSHAILLYQLEDKRIQTYFLGGKYPSRADSRLIFEAFGKEDAAQGFTIAQLSERTQIVSKKVRVILAYLENAGVIQRKKRYVKVQNFASQEEFETFLAEYEQRHMSDRDRLQEMMHYGQTLKCRVQFLREYFGEDMGAQCKRCDNCNSACETVIGGFATNMTLDETELLA